ncbi:hypothetical protein [Georgenia deserti]|uniref:Uncharacterized protein n=1 Tax=Georgenia deserti TaxID=2093781 RepID=A0ABW4L767_9MICO
MTIAGILLTILVVLIALGVLAVLLGPQKPEQGYLAWLRESYHAWRSDELGRDKVAAPVSQEARVDELFSLGTPDDRPAYARPEEFVARWDEVRDRARHITKR